MRKNQIVVLAFFILAMTLSCNLPVATGTEKMKPQHFETTGDRTTYSGDYSCESQDDVSLDIDENGIAHLSSTGPVFVDHINCTLDPSGFRDTYTIDGLADPDTQQVTFTSCNEGGFTAEGMVTYRNGSPIGDVSCKYTKGDSAGQLAIMLWVPAK